MTIAYFIIAACALAALETLVVIHGRDNEDLLGFSAAAFAFALNWPVTLLLLLNAAIIYSISCHAQKQPTDFRGMMAQLAPKPKDSP